MKRITKNSPGNNRVRTNAAFSPEAAQSIRAIFGEGYCRLSRKQALEVASACIYSAQKNTSLYRGMKEMGALTSWIDCPKKSALKALYSLGLSNDDLLALAEDLTRKAREGHWKSKEKDSLFRYAKSMGFDIWFCGDTITLEDDDLTPYAEGSHDYILALLKTIDREERCPHPSEQADALARLSELINKAGKYLEKAISLVEKKDLALPLPLTQEEKDTWAFAAVPYLLELDRFVKLLDARQKEALSNVKYWEVDDDDE